MARGWSWVENDQTPCYKGRSIGIALSGNRDEPASPEMLDTLQKVIDCGVKNVSHAFMQPEKYRKNVHVDHVDFQTILGLFSS